MFRLSAVLTIIVAMICTLNAWADETAMQTEIDQLNQRVEDLEKQLNELKSPESGTSETIAEKVSIGGLLAGAYQYQSISGPSDAKDTDRGAVPVQPEISITPTEVDEIFFKFGFAAGNGLNAVTPFVLAPWAADLEDDVKDINGRNRDYLLTAWCKHTFEFGKAHTLGLTGGIIDATDYLDENAYANDEFTQFMNEALVNAPHGFAPSYDIGGAAEWAYRQFSAKGVIMGVGENDDGRAYNFFGLQVGYTLDTALGEGTYRVIYQGTSEDFLDPSGAKKERCECLFLSFDQQFGDIIGGWIRVGARDDAAAINYEHLYSGGINISGALWGREIDNFGIGYAYLEGGNQGIDYTQVAEAYLRLGLNDIFAVTLDGQYMEDNYDSGEGEDVDGWITGVRLAAEF